MCTSNFQSKDQTSKEAKEYIVINKIASPNGIGFFLVPAPEVGIYEFKKVTVKDLSYAETAKRGLNCEAFKYLPYGISLIHGEKGSLTINSMQDLDDFHCQWPCAGGYGPDCWASHCYCTSFGNGCI